MSCHRSACFESSLAPHFTSPLRSPQVLHHVNVPLPLSSAPDLPTSTARFAGRVAAKCKGWNMHSDAVSGRKKTSLDSSIAPSPWGGLCFCSFALLISHFPWTLLSFCCSFLKFEYLNCIYPKMTSFITNYIQNTAMGMLSSGITAAGNVAGNAVGGVGTMIQSSGQAVGTGMVSPINSQICTLKLTHTSRRRRQHQELGRLHQQLRRPRNRRNSTKRRLRPNSSEEAKSSPSTREGSRCDRKAKSLACCSLFISQSPSCSSLQAKHPGSKHAFLRRRTQEDRRIRSFKTKECCLWSYQSFSFCSWPAQTLKTFRVRSTSRQL